MDDVACLVWPSRNPNGVSVILRWSETEAVWFLVDWQFRLDLSKWRVCALGERTVPLVVKGETGDSGEFGEALGGDG